MQLQDLEKTTTIIDSASHLHPGQRALFCAFNNSIAKEIQKRFTERNNNQVTVKTIHALGYDILKSNTPGDYKVIPKKYDEIIEKGLKHGDFTDEVYQLLDINSIKANPTNRYEEGHLRKFRFALKQTLNDLSNKFRLTLTPDTHLALKNLIIHYNILPERKRSTERFEEEVEVYGKLNKKIIETGNQIATKLLEIDFSDMLYIPYIQKFGPVQLFDFLFVDECQDLSRSQLAIALKYVKANGRVLAVCDPCQSIYGFTGAYIESFNKIQTTLHATPLSLSHCFRCPDEVIAVAQQFRSDITAYTPKPGTVRWLDLKEIIDVAKAGDLIICRRKAPLLELMFELIERNIQVEVHEDEVKEFINDLKFLFLPDELRKQNPFQHENFIDDVRARNVQNIEIRSKRIQDIGEKEEFILEETTLLDSKLDFIEKQMVLPWQKIAS